MKRMSKMLSCPPNYIKFHHSAHPQTSVSRIYNNRGCSLHLQSLAQMSLLPGSPPRSFRLNQVPSVAALSSFSFPSPFLAMLDCHRLGMDLSPPDCEPQEAKTRAISDTTGSHWLRRREQQQVVGLH